MDGEAEGGGDRGGDGYLPRPHPHSIAVPAAVCMREAATSSQAAFWVILWLLDLVRAVWERSCVQFPEPPSSPPLPAIHELRRAQMDHLRLHCVGCLVQWHESHSGCERSLVEFPDKPCLLIFYDWQLSRWVLRLLFTLAARANTSARPPSAGIAAVCVEICQMLTPSHGRDITPWSRQPKFKY